MTIRFISVDSGKADTKVCTKLNGDGSVVNRSFPTRVKEIPERESLESLTGMSGSGFIVSYDGKIYAVGDIANSDDSITSNQNSKNDNIHKITTLTAIAGSVNNDDLVNVVIGCPIEVYMNKANREKYLDNILPSGRIDITINGINKHFMIKKKMVLPESTGILYAYPGVFVGKLAGIIDIGGLNINAALVDDLKLMPESSFTEKLGRRFAENEIRRYANDTYESSFSVTEINNYIKQGYITDNVDPDMEKKSGEFIDSVLDDHLIKIVKACKKHGWNLRNMELVFIGGGSILLKDKISQVFPKAHIVEDAAFTNAQGFLYKLCRSFR